MFTHESLHAILGPVRAALLLNPPEGWPTFSADMGAFVCPAHCCS